MSAIHAYPFEFATQVSDPEADLGAFLNWLDLQSGQLWPISKNSSRGIVIHCKTDNIKNIWYGAIVSRSLLQDIYSQQGGQFIKMNIPPGSVLNFFAMRRDSFRGLYSQYHGTISISNFIDGLYKDYHSFVHAKKAEAIRNLGALEEKQELKAEKILNKRFAFRGKKKQGILQDKTNFRNELENIASLNKVSFSLYDHAAEKFPDDEPELQQGVKTACSEYSFNDISLTRHIKDWLIQCYTLNG